LRGIPSNLLPLGLLAFLYLRSSVYTRIGIAAFQQVSKEFLRRVEDRFGSHPSKPMIELVSLQQSGRGRPENQIPWNQFAKVPENCVMNASVLICNEPKNEKNRALSGNW
jgi:hypothetical protein